MKDPSYTLPTMQKKLASNDPSQVDAATAFIAVDSNALDILQGRFERDIVSVEV